MTNLDPESKKLVDKARAVEKTRGFLTSTEWDLLAATIHRLGRLAGHLDAMAQVEHFRDCIAFAVEEDDGTGDLLNDALDIVVDGLEDLANDE